MDFTFGLFIEISLTEKGDKRLEFIDKVIARLRDEQPTLPGQGTPNDPALPRGAGKPIND